MRNTRGLIPLLCTSLALLQAGSMPAIAQEALPTTRPLLEQLNRETQSLYKETSQAIVRVQLPMRTDALSMLGANPLEKWRDQLDPQALRKIDQLQQRVPTASYLRVEIQPSPASSAAGNPPANQPGMILLTLNGFWPNSMGAVIDDQGHVMVPHYVDKEAFDQPISVALADGRLAQATFVASDKQTDLTVLKLQNVKSKPISLDAPRAANGSLMLIVSLNPASNRLAVWTGGEPDLAIAINTDGSLAGFTAGGHFREGSTCKPIARELIDYGQVRRASLGVVIQTVGADDPNRAPGQVLQSTAALRIVKVLSGSAAEHGGLKPGDLILKVAGQPVGDPTAFAAAIARGRGKTEMVLLRDGQQITVDVDLEVR